MGVYEELVSGFFRDESVRPSFVLSTSSHKVYSKSHFDVDVTGNRGRLYLGIVPERDGQEVFIGPTPRNFFMTTGTILLPNFLTGTSTDANADSAELESPRRTNLRNTIRTFTSLETLRVERMQFFDVQDRLLEKVVINSCLQPVTALFSAKHGALLHNPAADRLVWRIASECAEVVRMHRNHIGLPPSSRFGPDRIVNSVTQACLKTPSAQSAMLEDVIARRITAVSYVNGYIVELGRAYGVPTPVNELVCDLVKMKWRLRNAMPRSVLSKIADEEERDDSDNDDSDRWGP
jgi:2-dehydropantoate 2-reductase